jgi:hypothetical protein
MRKMSAGDFYDLRVLARQLAAHGVTTNYVVLKGEPVLIVLAGGRKASSALGKIFPVSKKGWETNLLIFSEAPPHLSQDDYFSLEKEASGAAWANSSGVTLFRGKVSLSVAGKRPGTRRLKDVGVYVILGRAVPDRPTALAGALPVELPRDYLAEQLTSAELASLR